MRPRVTSPSPLPTRALRQSGDSLSRREGDIFSHYPRAEITVERLDELSELHGVHSRSTAVTILPHFQSQPSGTPSPFTLTYHAVACGAVSPGDFKFPMDIVQLQLDEGERRLFPEPTTCASTSTHRRPVTRVVASRDGILIATASLDRTVQVHSPGEGVVATFQLPLLGHVSDLRFSADSRELAVAVVDKPLRVYSIASQAVVHQGARTARTCDFAPDGCRLVIAHSTGFIELLQADCRHPSRAANPSCLDVDLAQQPQWDTTPDRAFALETSVDPLPRADACPDQTCVRFSHDSTRFVTGDASGNIRLWRVPSLECVLRTSHTHLPVYALEWAPFGTYVAAMVGEDACELHILDVDCEHFTQRVASTNDRGPYQTAKCTPSLSFSTDGRLILTQAHNGAITAWRTPEPFHHGAQILAFLCGSFSESTPIHRSFFSHSLFDSNVAELVFGLLTGRGPRRGVGDKQKRFSQRRQAEMGFEARSEDARQRAAATVRRRKHPIE